MWRGKHLLLRGRLAVQCMEYQSRSVSLLQNDKDIETRRRNLEKAKTKYQLEQKTFKLTEDQRNQINVVDVPHMVSVFATVISFIKMNRKLLICIQVYHKTS